MRSKILPRHCTSGRALEAVDGVVVHYFSGRNVDRENRFDLQVCWDLFCDLNRPRDARRRYMKAPKWPEKRMYASAHLLIGRDGETWKLVEFDRQAYHAGASLLNGRAHCNRWTLGIELVGDLNSGFSAAQYRALVDILVELEAAHGFPRENVAGHDKVRFTAIQAGQAKAKKYDPSGRPDGDGDNFDWFYLGKLWNDTVPNPAGTTTLADLDAVIDADPLSS